MQWWTTIEWHLHSQIFKISVLRVHCSDVHIPAQYTCTTPHCIYKCTLLFYLGNVGNTLLIRYVYWEQQERV